MVGVEGTGAGDDVLVVGGRVSQPEPADRSWSDAAWEITGHVTYPWLIAGGAFGDECGVGEGAGVFHAEGREDFAGEELLVRHAGDLLDDVGE